MLITKYLVRYLAFLSLIMVMLNSVTVTWAIDSSDLLDELDISYANFEITDEFPFFNKILELENDQILISGHFLYMNGVRIANLARLNADGSVDPSFNSNIQVSGTVFDGVQALVEQPDGKFIIGGGIVSVGGQPRIGLARLNANGSLDQSFNIALSNNGRTLGMRVSSIAVQSDSKIIIAGNFRQVNGVNREGLARLNSDGSLDTSFAAIDPGERKVFSIALQADNKIILGGRSMNVNGQTRNLARFNSNGSLDTTFTTDVNSLVTSVVFQANGQLIAGGRFTTVTTDSGTSSREGLVRLNSNGSLDESYDVGIDDVASLALFDDDRLLVAGQFFSIAGLPRRGVAIVLANGNVDNTFSPINLQGARTAAALSDGTIIAASELLLPNFLDSYQVVKFNPDGSRVDDFFVGLVEDQDGEITDIIPYLDGVLIIGPFLRVNGQPRKSIAKLDARGRVDRNFRSTPDRRYFDAAITEDNKIVVVGNFTFIDGNPSPLLGRLNQNGSFDSTFTGQGVQSFPLTVEKLANNKLVVAGGAISRHHADGSLDSTFSASTNSSSFINSVAEQSDGKLIIGGGFTQINNVGQAYLARLDTDGSLDGSFTPVITSSSTRNVNKVVLEENGDIVFGGRFSMVNGSARSNLARVDSTGIIDDSFLVDYQRGVDDILPLDDGSFLLSGVSQIGAERDIPSVILLDNNGAVDFSFNPMLLNANESRSTANTLAIDSNGGLLVSSRFAFANGQPRKNLARFGESLPEEDFCLAVKTASGSVVSFCL